MNGIENLLSTSISDLDVISVGLNFILCVGMSFIARTFYIRFSTSLTGKHHIGTVIPILSTIVFLVILVVKSSLALSLGLVGALSIVRFRTPIKEPEELVYLFLAIAIGLGYAAGYSFLTTILTLSILLMIYLWLSNKSITSKDEYNIVLSWPNSELKFEILIEKIMGLSTSLKLLRLNKGPQNNSAVFLIVPDSQFSIDEIINQIEELDSNIDISFYESKTNW
tara:strand:+ start:1982 stop:2653 length:672 start_codon:yes stop_codon:yes gene_type:complete